MVYMDSRILFTHEKWNYVDCGAMHGTRDYHANQPDSEIQVLHALILYEEYRFKSKKGKQTNQFGIQQEVKRGQWRGIYVWNT